LQLNQFEKREQNMFYQNIDKNMTSNCVLDNNLTTYWTIGNNVNEIHFKCLIVALIFIYFYSLFDTFLFEFYN
jgi:hypothetical protein